MRPWRHIERLWPKATIWPAAPFVLWAAFFAVRGQLRWDHVAMAALVGVLAFGNEKTKRLYVGLLPVGLVGLFYDAMRFVKNVGLTPEGVHLCNLRGAELRLFGLDDGGARVTLHDYFQARATLWLDVLMAIPYGTFLMVVVGYAIFLFVRDFSAQQRFTWGFFALNVLGYVTYHLYPAAPPWYFHAHGCVVDLAAAPSAGPNLVRVDALLGVPYFTGFYGRASDVFGAVPSLHVAYPFLMVTEGWSRHRALGRSLLIGFYAWMCFAAVYLDHHWLIDVLLGTAYALVVAIGSRKLACRRPAESQGPGDLPGAARRAELGHG